MVDFPMVLIPGVFRLTDEMPHELREPYESLQ